MRSDPRDYEWKRPARLSDALALLARKPGEWKPFAGGTDVMVLFEAGRLEHRRWLDLSLLCELREIIASGESITIGAASTYTDVQADPAIQKYLPMLGQAAAETGAIAIQNRGTLGGNLANASPAADSSPVLLAYDAEIELISESGTRRFPYSQFHTGYKQTEMRPDELIRAVHVQRPSSSCRQQFRKVGTRKAQAISKICFSGFTEFVDGRLSDVRLAFGSVGPTALRCFEAERILNGKTPAEAVSARSFAAVVSALKRDIAPIDDIRSTGEYRRKVSENLVRDFLDSL